MLLLLTQFIVIIAVQYLQFAYTRKRAVNGSLVDLCVSGFPLISVHKPRQERNHPFWQLQRGPQSKACHIFLLAHFNLWIFSNQADSPTHPPPFCVEGERFNAAHTAAPTRKNNNYTAKICFEKKIGQCLRPEALRARNGCLENRIINRSWSNNETDSGKTGLTWLA